MNMEATPVVLQGPSHAKPCFGRPQATRKSQDEAQIPWMTMLWGILSSNALTLLGFNYVLAGYCKAGPRSEAIAVLSAVTPLELFAEGYPCRLSPIRQIAVLVKGWTSVWFPYTVGTVIPALFRHAGAVYALLSFVLPVAYFMAILACKLGRWPYKHAHRGYVLALVAGPELLSLVVTVQRVSRRLSPSDTRMMPISQPFFLYVFNIARPLIVMVFKAPFMSYIGSSSHAWLACEAVAHAFASAAAIAEYGFLCRHYRDQMPSSVTFKLAACVHSLDFIIEVLLAKKLMLWFRPPTIHALHRPFKGIRSGAPRADASTHPCSSTMQDADRSAFTATASDTAAATAGTARTSMDSFLADASISLDPITFELRIHLPHVDPCDLPADWLQRLQTHIHNKCPNLHVTGGAAWKGSTSIILHLAHKPKDSKRMNTDASRTGTDAQDSSVPDLAGLVAGLSPNYLAQVLGLGPSLSLPARLNSGVVQKQPQVSVSVSADKGSQQQQQQRRMEPLHAMQYRWDDAAAVWMPVVAAGPPAEGMMAASQQAELCAVKVVCTEGSDDDSSVNAPAMRMRVAVQRTANPEGNAGHQQLVQQAGLRLVLRAVAGSADASTSAALHPSMLPVAVVPLSPDLQLPKAAACSTTNMPHEQDPRQVQYGFAMPPQLLAYAGGCPSGSQPRLLCVELYAATDTSRPLGSLCVALPRLDMQMHKEAEASTMSQCGGSSKQTQVTACPAAQDAPGVGAVQGCGWRSWHVCNARENVICRRWAQTVLPYRSVVACAMLATCVSGALQRAPHSWWEAAWSLSNAAVYTVELLALCLGPWAGRRWLLEHAQMIGTMHWVARVCSYGLMACWQGPLSSGMMQTLHHYVCKPSGAMLRLMMCMWWAATDVMVPRQRTVLRVIEGLAFFAYSWRVAGLPAQASHSAICWTLPGIASDSHGTGLGTAQSSGLMLGLLRGCTLHALFAGASILAGRVAWKWASMGEPGAVPTKAVE